MKRLFITLGLTLLLAIAYYGSAHADVKSRQSQPTQRNGIKNPATKVEAAVKPAEKAVPTSLKEDEEKKDESKAETKAETKSSNEGKKDDKGNTIVKEYSRQLEKGGTVISTITSDDKGKLTIQSKLDGCSKCVAQGELEKTELDKSGKKLEDLADIFNSKEFGKLAAQVKKDETKEEKAERLKAEREAKAELKENKEKARICLVDKDSFEVFTPAERVSCLEREIEALFDKRDSKSLKLAQELLGILAEQASTDIVNGNMQSPYVKSIQRFAAVKPDGSNIEDAAKYNTALAANAFAAKATYLNQYKKVLMLEQAASDNREQAQNSTNPQARAQLMAKAQAQTQQANIIKQGMEQNKQRAQTEVNKFLKTSATTSGGFNKEDIVERFADKAGENRAFYSDILNAADPIMGNPVSKVSTGNTAADSAGGTGKYAIDYNTNLESLKKEVTRGWESASCRQYGSLMQGCAGNSTPANIPSTPSFGTGATAFPPAANINQPTTSPQQPGNLPRMNYNATNGGGRG